MPLSAEQYQRLLAHHPTLRALPSCSIVNCHFSESVVLEEGASVVWSFLDDHAAVGTHSSLCGARVGRHASIGEDCTIGSADAWASPRDAMETVIGRNVTVGPHCTIECGARIPDNVIIPPRSTIKRESPRSEITPRPSVLYRLIVEHLPLVHVHKLWVEDRGDETLRLTYDLQPTDIVLDAGGYQGDWAAAILERYHPRLHVFEPVERFAKNIRDRLGAAVCVHAVGLAGNTREENISLEAEGSSVIKDSPGARHERIRLLAAADVLRDIVPPHADIALLKMNIEGCEFELLEHLLDTGWIERIRHLQVQFHEFVPQARQRRQALRQRLAATHTERWNYPFIWEAWERHRSPLPP